jgi:hypothetical protein
MVRRQPAPLSSRALPGLSGWELAADGMPTASKAEPCTALHFLAQDGTA